MIRVAYSRASKVLRIEEQATVRKLWKRPTRATHPEPATLTNRAAVE